MAGLLLGLLARFILRIKSKDYTEWFEAVCVWAKKKLHKGLDCKDKAEEILNARKEQKNRVDGLEYHKK